MTNASLFASSTFLPALAAASVGCRPAAPTMAAITVVHPAALEMAATLPEADMVMAAIVGAAGLRPTLAAARLGKRILLTASGGPFRSRPIESLAEVTPAQAVAHPNWVMGRKISVDSATMMNKGLEVIEACWLFGTTPAQIEVVIHPQSVIHSMVQYVDGSVLAQLGNPDMRTPIAYALAWPERCAAGVQRLDLFSVRHLDFEEPDYDRFPCLRLARDAMSAGGTAPAILNAANEVAVAAFLDEKIRYTDIPRLVGLALEQVSARPARDLDTIFADDFAARDAVERAMSHGVR